MHILEINDLEISNDKPLILISGPCVIESRDHSLKMAESIYEICNDIGINFIMFYMYEL